MCHNFLPLSVNNSPLYVYNTFCLSICQSADLSSFHLSATVNDATVNTVYTYKYLLDTLLLILSDIYPEVALLDHMVLLFVFVEE